MQPPTPQDRATRLERAAAVERDGMGVLVDYMHTGVYGPACPPSVRARVDAMMFAAPPEGAAAALRGRAGRPDYRPLLAGLDLPALVCAGSADPWSDEAVTAEIVGSLRRPETVVIDGVGHLPNLEAENEFNAALGAFLRAHAPG
jgi:3-oxoadipate enol-lactonase